jgi:DNA-binding Xre family transcriptional regulator
MKVKIKKTILVKQEVFEEVEMNFNQFIGYTISQLRIEKNISQEEFAEKIGLTRTSIVNIESGRQTLGLKYLEKICRALDCTSKDILNF